MAFDAHARIGSQLIPLGDDSIVDDYKSETGSEESLGHDKRARRKGGRVRDGLIAAFQFKCWFRVHR